MSSALHSLKIKVDIKERRKQVASLLSKAATEGEIAYKLGVNQSTISRDIGVLKEESQKYVYELAKESLAFFYTQSLDGINEAKLSQGLALRLISHSLLRSISQH